MLVAAGLLLAPVAGYASAPDFFQRHEDGWFFYKDGRKKKAPPSKKEAQPEAFKVERARQEMESRLHAAIEQPTEENILGYLTLQKEMIDRSYQFSQVWQKVLWAHPDLDPRVERPPSQLGAILASMEREQKVGGYLKDLAQRAGLFFFFSSHCPYCQREAEVIASFGALYGFPVKPVTIDGRCLEAFPGCTPDAGVATSLAVEQVPAVFLVTRGKDGAPAVQRVSTGFVTLDELAYRIWWLGRFLEEGKVL